MRWWVIIFLALGAHFALTALVPGEAGKAFLYWPFAKDSKPALNILGAAMTPATQLLAVIAGACFLAAIAALLGWFVPGEWWPWLVSGGAVASALLFVLYVGVNALIPLAINALLLWGIFVQHWTVAALRAG